MSKVAVVTGASRGLGVAIAQEFLARGFEVVGTGRSERPPSLDSRVEYARFDAADAGACDAFWQQHASSFSEASVCLVNNAGGYIGGSLMSSQADDFHKMIDSCFFAAAFMTRGLVQHIAQARIVNVISAVGLKPAKNNTAYGSAKAAERYFFQSLAAELDAGKYRITNVYPNTIATAGPAEHAVAPVELAAFICDQAEQSGSFFLPEVTVFAR